MERKGEGFSPKGRLWWRIMDGPPLHCSAKLQQQTAEYNLYLKKTLTVKENVTYRITAFPFTKGSNCRSTNFVFLLTE